MRRVYMFLLALALVLAGIVPSVTAQDQRVRITSNYVNITTPPGRAWSDMNRTFVFSPSSPDSSFCLYIHNQNTTNAHTFTLAAFQSGDQQVQDFSNNTDHYNSLSIVGTASPVAAAGAGTGTNSLYIHANAAAWVALQFTGAATAAGSPDNADIWLVQTTASSCGAVNPSTGQQYSLSTPNSGTSATPPIQAVSDGLSQAYNISPTQTNPASGAILAAVNDNSSAKSLFFDKVIISASVAANVSVNGTSTVGNCAGLTATNLKLGAANNSTASVTGGAVACGTPPNPINASLNNFFIAANSSVVIDIRGFIAPAGTTTGMDISLITGVTGQVTATFIWYEK